MGELIAKTFLFLCATAMALGGGYLLGQLIFVKFEWLSFQPMAGAFVIAFMIFRTLYRSRK